MLTCFMLIVSKASKQTLTWKAMRISLEIAIAIARTFMAFKNEH